MEKLLSDVVLTCKYLRDNVTQLGQLINTPLPVGSIPFLDERHYVTFA